MKKQDKVLVVITGGTIESYYDPQHTPYHVPLEHGVKDSIIPRAMEMLGLTRHCDYYPICIKDSKENTLLPEMDALLHHIAENSYSKVIVVHGTDTMPTRAQEFKRRLSDMETHGNMDKVRVVFTGAMTPLRTENKPDGAFRGLDAYGRPDLGDKGCDGWGNLRLAFEDVQNINPGVFIEAGYGPWNADEVLKYVEAGSKSPDSRVTNAQFIHTPGVRQDDLATGRSTW